MPDRVPVRFIIGSRQIAAVPRQLETIRYSLQDLLDGKPPQPRPLPAGCDGYRVLSAPLEALDALTAAYPGYRIGGLQTYHRRYIAMDGTFEDYLARFSSKTRATLLRKQRKLAALDGDRLDIAEFHGPDTIDAFFAEALPLSRKTYQARLLDAGLPETAAFRDQARALAAAGQVRAYILRLHGQPIAYLYLPIEDGTLVYAYLGYDAAHANLSAGTVLQLQALERLYAEGGFRYFDFTEGDGAHKELFSTGSAAACSLFLLAPTPANRLVLGSLDLFNRGVALAKGLAARSGANAFVRKVLRS